MRSFWRHADTIIRSTRLAHEIGYDRDRAALAAEMRERRVFEMTVATGAATSAIEISGT